MSVSRAYRVTSTPQFYVTKPLEQHNPEIDLRHQELIGLAGCHGTYEIVEGEYLMGDDEPIEDPEAPIDEETYDETSDDMTYDETSDEPVYDESEVTYDEAEYPSSDVVEEVEEEEAYEATAPETYAPYAPYGPPPFPGTPGTPQAVAYPPIAVGPSAVQARQEQLAQTSLADRVANAALSFVSPTPPAPTPALPASSPLAALSRLMKPAATTPAPTPATSPFTSMARMVAPKVPLPPKPGVVRVPAPRFPVPPPPSAPPSSRLPSFTPTQMKFVANLRQGDPKAKTALAKLAIQAPRNPTAALNLQALAKLNASLPVVKPGLKLRFSGQVAMGKKVSDTVGDIFRLVLSPAAWAAGTAGQLSHWAGDQLQTLARKI